jgi:DNA-binding transcriptional regulator YhcF (GntR family)
MKTIRELSAEMRISKVSIYKAIKRPEMQPFISKTSDNVTVVNEAGAALLIGYFNQEKEIAIANIAAVTENGDSSEQFLTMLKDELSQKNCEINSLLKIIANQQALDGQRLIKDRHSQLLLTGSTPTPAPPRQTGFLNRFFRRNNSFR